MEIQRQRLRLARSEWEARMAQAPVAIDHLPKRVAQKVLQMVMSLERGESYQLFKGKRMITLGQRNVISLPVGRDHRLICRERDGALEYLEVITHEEYNSRLASGGWT